MNLSAVDRHPAIVGTEQNAGPARLQQIWRDESDTAEFAARLAANPLLRNAFIALRGDLGAGKTTLVRHLLRALGVPGRIKSPTYAVVEPHEAPGRTPEESALAIWHFDFYRFSDPREWEEAGFRDLFASDGLKLAEWPDKAAGVLPVADVDIELTVRTDDSRLVLCHAKTPAGVALLQGLAA